MSKHILLEFDDFPIIFTTIEIPKNTLLLRGFLKEYPIISDRPAYFTSSASVALGYGDTLGIFKSKKVLKLFDLRYINALLPSIFNKRKKISKDTDDAIYNLTLSYGLCSLTRQMEIFRMRYRDNLDGFKDNIKSIEDFQKSPVLIEHPGIRIGETVNDSMSILLLKKLFGGVIDGYIAPKIESPFHIEKNNVITAEIVLFNPIKCIHKIANSPPNIVQVPIENINNHKLFLIPLFDTKAYFAGGGTSIKKLPNPNRIFDENGPEFKQMDTQTDKMVKGVIGSTIVVDGRITTQKLLLDGPSPWPPS